MINKLRRARADLTTMNSLLPAAERIARDDGSDKPGAEHLLLAALEMGDGIAADTLGEFGVDARELRAAIVGQHEDALRSIGVVADDNAIGAALPATEPPTGPYRSQGSLQTAFQEAVAVAKHDKVALNSGHILLAVTDNEYGTVARALQYLGTDRDRLREVTRERLAR